MAYGRHARRSGLKKVRAPLQTLSRQLQAALHQLLHRVLLRATPSTTCTAKIPWSAPTTSIISAPPPPLGGCALRSSCALLYINPLHNKKVLTPTRTTPPPPPLHLPPFHNLSTEHGKHQRLGMPQRPRGRSLVALLRLHHRSRLICEGRRVVLRDVLAAAYHVTSLRRTQALRPCSDEFATESHTYRECRLWPSV
jgi:hypothetical protein